MLLKLGDGWLCESSKSIGSDASVIGEYGGASGVELLSETPTSDASTLVSGIPNTGKLAAILALG